MEKIKEHHKYWLGQFSGEIPILNLPTEYTRPAVEDIDEDSAIFEIGSELTEELREMVIESSSNLDTILLAAFNILLSKYSKQEDIIIGSTTISGQHKCLDNILGVFMNTFAIRNYPRGEKSFREFLSEVRDSSLSAYGSQDYLLEELVEKLNIQRDFNPNPLFNVMFVFENPETDKRELKDLNISQQSSENKVSKFDLNMNVVEGKNSIFINLEYYKKLFSRDTIERMYRHLENILKIVVDNPDTKINEIELMTQKERQQILINFNNTAADYPKDKTMHGLFEEQAERTPNNIAVKHEEKKLTYRELNEKSNQLARLLRSKGVGPDSIVGIMVERSLEMIVGIMEILKAGGAYLPIDAEYPKDRIEYMEWKRGLG